MALAPSVIMSWAFSKELAARKMNRDSYAKWKQREEEARKRREEMRTK